MRFVAGRGAAAERLAGALCAKSYREDAAGCGHRDRAIAGWGVAAELHREATSRAASAEDQATQRGSTEQQPAH